MDPIDSEDQLGLRIPHHHGRSIVGLLAYFNI